MGYSGARLYNGTTGTYHAISRSESFEDLDLEKETLMRGSGLFCSLFNGEQVCRLIRRGLEETESLGDWGPPRRKMGKSQ